MICPACKADSLRPGKLLCFHCWNTLGKAMQTKVSKAWREFSGGRGGAAARDAYYTIRQRAINAATAARTAAAAKAPARCGH